MRVEIVDLVLFKIYITFTKARLAFDATMRVLQRAKRKQAALMVTFKFPTTALREVEGRTRQLSGRRFGREIFQLPLLAACLMPNVVQAQAQQDQLTLTADITAIGRATTSLPGVVDYHDNLSVTAHGLLVLERDAENTNSWVVVNTNYSLQVSGGGSEQDLTSTQSWTYSADSPDDLSAARSMVAMMLHCSAAWKCLGAAIRITLQG